MVDFKENLYLRRGAEGRAHIPPMPLWTGIVRVAQLVLDVLILILCAYASSVFGGGYFVGFGLGYYIFVWTLLFLAYVVLVPLFLPKFYVYWIQLILEIKTVIFWLATFALLADEAAAWNGLQALENIPNYNENGTVTSYTDLWPGANEAIGATKAAAGLGAFAWLSFCITLGFFSVAVYKHRGAKGPTTYNSSVNDAEKGPTVAQPVELREVPIAA
jgi:hypothetical protein